MTRDRDQHLNIRVEKRLIQIEPEIKPFKL